jgi:hypothetical protein
MAQEVLQLAYQTPVNTQLDPKTNADWAVNQATRMVYAKRLNEKKNAFAGRQAANVNAGGIAPSKQPDVTKSNWKAPSDLSDPQMANWIRHCGFSQKDLEEMLSKKE